MLKIQPLRERERLIYCVNSPFLCLEKGSAVREEVILVHGEKKRKERKKKDKCLICWNRATENRGIRYE